MLSKILVVFFLLVSPCYAATVALVKEASVEESGSADATATATFAAAGVAAINNLLITTIGMDKDSGAINTPSGWTLINDNNAASVSCAIAYKIANGTETGVTWTWTTNRSATLWVGEFSGLKRGTALDVAAENSTESAVTTLSSGTTATTTQTVELAIAFMACDSVGACNDSRSWSNSFSEEFFGGNVAASAPGLSVARLTTSTLGTKESTFTASGDVGDQMCTGIATFLSSNGFLL